MFLRGGFLYAPRGDDLLLKVFHVLFQNSFVGKDVPKGVLVPVLKVLLEKFQFDLEFVQVWLSCELRVLPPSCDHLMEI